jgi:hypothetical protein
LEPKVSRNDIARYTTEALARVLRVSPPEVADELARNNGDLVMPSKVTMAVAALLQRKLGRGKLFTPSDFGSDATTGASSGKVHRISPNGCMDPAEDTSFRRFLGIAIGKINPAADQ